MYFHLLIISYSLEKRKGHFVTFCTNNAILVRGHDGFLFKKVSYGTQTIGRVTRRINIIIIYLINTHTALSSTKLCETLKIHKNKFCFLFIDLSIYILNCPSIIFLVLILLSTVNETVKCNYEVKKITNNCVT